MYDFAFFNIFQNGFVRKECRIRHDFTFFEGISLRNDPLFYLSLHVRVFMFVVFFSIFKWSFVSFLLKWILKFLFCRFDLFDSDKFSQFGEFIFDLVEFFKFLLKFELILLIGFELFVSLARKELNFFVSFLMLLFERSKFSFSRLPLFLSDLSVRYDTCWSIVWKKIFCFSFLTRVVLIVLFP